MFPSLAVEALAAGLYTNESLFAAGGNAKFLSSDPGTLLLHFFSNNIKSKFHLAFFTVLSSAEINENDPLLGTLVDNNFEIFLFSWALPE